MVKMFLKYPRQYNVKTNKLLRRNFKSLKLLIEFWKMFFRTFDCFFIDSY